VAVSHKVEGSGPPLLLSSSLGTTHELWDPQVPALAARYRVVRYDHPGHGGSPAGPTTIEGFARAALELADELGLDRFAFCGLSLGGMVGQWLGAHAPDRVERLVLACTAPHLPPREQWLDRARTVREQGVEAVADAAIGRWLTDRVPAAERARWRALLVSTPREGYARACEALADMDLRADIARIEAPTTLVFGRHDPVVSDENTQLLAAVRGARVVELDAAHLANVEQPDAFTEAILS
jgi:3-oxoadipate enol-lactonase